jgi:LysM domain
VLNAWDLEDLVLWEQLMTAPAAPPRRPRPAQERSRRRPAGSRRPGGAPLRPGGTGVALSRARGPHRRRPITPATTVGLAVLAALITLWLGLVAQFGAAAHGATAPLPDRLAVVQVQSGESLQHVAARVAPDAPVGRVVERIRELNKLDTPSLAAGQTLIAPVD